MRFCPNCHIEVINYDSLSRIITKSFNTRNLLNHYLEEQSNRFERINWQHIKSEFQEGVSVIFEKLFDFLEKRYSEKILMVLSLVLYIVILIGTFFILIIPMMLIVLLINLVGGLFTSGWIVLVGIVLLFWIKGLKPRLVNRLCKKFEKGEFENEFFKPLIAEIQYKAKRHIKKENEKE